MDGYGKRGDREGEVKRIGADSLHLRDDQRDEGSNALPTIISVTASEVFYQELGPTCEDINVYARAVKLRNELPSRADNPPCWIGAKVGASAVATAAGRPLIR